MSSLHHSAAVHVPLALAILFPLSHVLLLILLKANFLPRRVWLLQWGMCAVQLIGSSLSYFTGQRDLVLSSAPTELLNQHQELAKWFALIWILIFIVLPLAFWIRNFLWSAVLHGVLLALLGTQLYLAIHLGQIGGKLVFGI